eukprot:SAG31_NODE_9804_length_1225_cov_1.001776_1_plen_243_part_00
MPSLSLYQVTHRCGGPEVLWPDAGGGATAPRETRERVSRPEVSSPREAPTGPEGSSRQPAASRIGFRGTRHIFYYESLERKKMSCAKLDAPQPCRNASDGEARQQQQQPAAAARAAPRRPSGRAVARLPGLLGGNPPAAAAGRQQHWSTSKRRSRLRGVSDAACRRSLAGSGPPGRRAAPLISTPFSAAPAYSTNTLARYRTAPYPGVHGRTRTCTLERYTLQRPALFNYLLGTCSNYQMYS